MPKIPDLLSGTMQAHFVFHIHEMCQSFVFVCFQPFYLNMAQRKSITVPYIFIVPIQRLPPTLWGITTGTGTDSSELRIGSNSHNRNNQGCKHKFCHFVFEYIGYE